MTWAPLWNQKGAKVTLYGLAAAIVVTTGAAHVLTRLSYVPQEPVEISRKFLDLVQAGELRGAYLLTDQGALVGRTPAAFEANVRRQLGIDAFPTSRRIELIGTGGGFQSYGNRLRRWIMGRKIDPDQVRVDYFVGAGLPFDISLRSNETGQWQITFFQSHAM
jgi:hypothetical protein